MEGIKRKLLIRQAIFVCLASLMMLLSSCDVGLFLERFTPDIRLTDGHYLLSTDGFRYSLQTDDPNTNAGVHEYIVAYLLTDTSIYLVQMTALDRDNLSSDTEFPEKVLECHYHEFNHLTDSNTLHVNSAEWIESIRNENPDLAVASAFKFTASALNQYCLQRVSWS